MSELKNKAVVRVEDNGAIALIERVKKSSVGIEFGILGPKAAGKYASGSPATVAEIAGYHEFGTKTIPERSFLRGWFESEETKHREFIKKLTGKFLEGKVTSEQFVELAGQYAVGGMQKRIAGKIPPPLAQSTLDKRHGKPKPPPKAALGKIPKGVKSKYKPRQWSTAKPAKKKFGDTPLIDTGLLRSSLSYRLYKP